MIPRTLENKLHELASYYPAVLVTGPRQSGKTTLCQIAFPDKRYVSLEATLCMAAMNLNNALMHRRYPGVMFND